MSDLISRQYAINAIENTDCELSSDAWDEITDAIMQVPSAQPETCEGCKHLGKWENEVEYGYNSLCTGCRRRASDRYER